MINFEFATYGGLQPFDNYSFSTRIESFFVPGEKTLATYIGKRGRIVAFTNKRVIATSLEGLRTGQTDYSTLPYRKVHVFSVEAPGDIDFDGALQISDIDYRTARFEFNGEAKVKEICKVLGEFVLQ